MTSTCPSEEELILLHDGETTENRADVLRAHLGECSVCRATTEDLRALTRGIAAPVMPVDVDAQVERLMRRLDAPVRPASKSRGRSLAWSALAFASAIAAIFLVGPRFTGSGERTETFQSRGGGSGASLQRDTGVSVYRVGRQPSRLASNALVDPLTAYTAGYRNLRAEGTYLMLFAVDSAASVHWLYPAFTDPKEDPSSVTLAKSVGETLLPTSVVLDRPALGPLRIVSLITTDAVHVSTIESLKPPELSSDALRHRFPSSAVEELVVNVGPEKK